MSFPSPHIPLSARLEQAWLQRYLDRELDEDECAWFEAYALSHPHLFDAIEADNALRATLVATASYPDIEAAARTAPSSEAPAPEPSGAVPGSHGRRRWSAWSALAASFVGGLGLAGLLLPRPAPLDFDEPGIEAPARLVFDQLRGGPVQLREDQGDPRARLMVVDIALPLGSHIAAAHAELGTRRVDLPAARISGEGFATYTLPRSWRGHAQLHFDLQSAGGDALPPVQVQL